MLDIDFMMLLLFYYYLFSIIKNIDMEILYEFSISLLIVQRYKHKLIFDHY